jgi:hypothetical protein
MKNGHDLKVDDGCLTLHYISFIFILCLKNFIQIKAALRKTLG